MKALVLAVLALFSVSSFACRVNIDVINKEVAKQLVENLQISSKTIETQELVKVKDFFSETSVQDCPDASIYYHSFVTKDAEKECSIMTKFKESNIRLEINKFSIMDIDCQ
jgi:hypothetical protein